MGVSVAWDDLEHTIIRFDYQGAWTWDEFRAANAKSYEMGKGSVARLDVINVLHPGASTPAGVLLNVREVMTNHPPNLRLTIIVNPGRRTQTFISLFSQAFAELSRNWRTCATLDEARAIIREDRARGGQG